MKTFLSCLISLFIVINILGSYKPVIQKLETNKKDSILIDIIKNNPQEKYLLISEVNFLSPCIFKEIYKNVKITELYNFTNNINLHDAINYNYSPSLLMYIIQNNPDLIFQQNEYKEYPLHVALNNKINIDIIQELLIRGRKINTESIQNIDTYPPMEEGQTDDQYFDEDIEKQLKKIRERITKIHNGKNLEIEKQLDRNGKTVFELLANY